MGRVRKEEIIKPSLNDRFVQIGLGLLRETTRYAGVSVLDVLPA
jgi:hypothetical protein